MNIEEYNIAKDKLSEELDSDIISAEEYIEKMNELDNELENEDVAENISINKSLEKESTVRSAAEEAAVRKKKRIMMIGIPIIVILLAVLIMYILFPCKFVGHDYKGEVTKKMDCGHNGVMTYTCTVCDDSYTEPIPADGNHDWGKSKVIKKATCGDEGKKEYTCKVCGKKRTKAIDATGDHIWGDWVVSEKATYESTGEKKRTCKVCGENDYKTIPVKSHKDEKILDSNGKQLWKVYVEDGYMTFSGNFNGSGYFGVTVLDSNQDFEELIVNEVGSYVLEEKTVYLENGWHYIQIECSDGTWNMTWWGTGGE